LTEKALLIWIILRFSLILDNSQLLFFAEQEKKKKLKKKLKRGYVSLF
jgi:hypothetical protein